MAGRSWVVLVVTIGVVTGEAAGRSPWPLQEVPFSAVKLGDSCWSTRQRVNCERTIPHLVEMCEREGRVRNLLRAAGQLDGDFEGTRRHDADLFKVIEAAAYTLVFDPNADLDAKLDKLIATIAAAQREDGYLHTYFQVRAEGDRQPTKLNLFAAGHLIDAGVTHHQVTGKTTLLTVAVRMADLIDSQYGPDALVDVPSHPKLESALILCRGTARIGNLGSKFLAAHLMLPWQSQRSGSTCTRRRRVPSI